MLVVGLSCNFLARLALSYLAVKTCFSLGVIHSFGVAFMSGKLWCARQKTRKLYFNFLSFLFCFFSLLRFFVVLLMAVMQVWMYGGFFCCCCCWKIGNELSCVIYHLSIFFFFTDIAYLLIFSLRGEIMGVMENGAWKRSEFPHGLGKNW